MPTDHTFDASNAPDPPPDLDGDADLRRDIADELIDHLELSARAKQLRGEDEQAAQQHAVDAFGDPDTLAKKLYLSAMKGRLMRQNFQAAAIFLMAIAVVVLGIGSWSTLQSGQQGMTEAIQQNNQALIDAIAQLPFNTNEPADTEPAGPDAMAWSKLTVELVDAQGRPFDAAGYQIGLDGELLNDSSIDINQYVASGNSITFGPLRVGQHRLEVVTPDSRLRYYEKVTVWAGRDGQRIKVACPTALRDHPQPRIEIDWPDDLQDAELALVLDIGIKEALTVGHDVWRFYPPSLLLRPLREPVCVEQYSYDSHGYKQTIQTSASRAVHWTAPKRLLKAITYDAIWIDTPYTISSFAFVHPLGDKAYVHLDDSDDLSTEIKAEYDRGENLFRVQVPRERWDLVRQRLDWVLREQATVPEFGEGQASS